MFLIGALAVSLGAQTSTTDKPTTKPCVAAAPPETPTIAGRLWHKAKRTAHDVAEKQLGKAGGKVNAATHGTFNPDTQGTADQAIAEAEKPKPCTAPKDTK